MYYRYEEIKEWESNQDSFNLIDARPGVAEPGKHIPGSAMMPYPEFQYKSDKGYTTMKDPKELK